MELPNVPKRSAKLGLTTKFGMHTNVRIGCRECLGALPRGAARLSRSDDTFGRRVLAGSCAGGAALCLALLALQSFGGTPPPMSGTQFMSLGLSIFPPSTFSVVSSSSSGLMILVAPAAAIWGFSVHIRCSDARVRHCLKGVALLVGLWMLDVLVKYRYPIENQRLIAFLWYLYYVPMTLIPTLCLLCAVRASGLDAKPWAVAMRRVLVAVDAALIVFVLTNGTHFQVFSFDISAPDWQNSYAYNWGYRLAVVIYIAEYLAFFGFLFATSRRMLHGVIGLLVIASVPFAAYAILYALRREFAVTTNFSLNYCLVVVALLELALDFGLLPSYAWYDEAFSRLPLDLKVLEQDGSIAFATDVADALPAAVLDLASDAARSPARGRVTRFRTSAIPHALFKAYGVSGGAALLAEDVTILDEQRRMLAERQERLRRSNGVLQHEGAVRRELWRLESEDRLLRNIEASIADKVERMGDLLAVLPRGDSPRERAERRDILTEVKLLVAYCKRKGALVLSEESNPEFDRDRLQLVFNETASDLRSIGVDCAAVVSVEGVLPACVVSVLYDCLYDVASVALFATEPILMLFVSGNKTGVQMRAALEVAEALPERLEAAVENLRENLSAQTGGSLSLEASPTSLNVAVRMCVPDAMQSGGGAP